MSFFNELKRRNVIRVGIAYVVTAWLIIQVIETLFPVFGLSNQSIRITVIILAFGLLPVLFFAWALELTSAGIKWEKDVDRNQSVSSKTGKKLDRWVIVMMTLALTYFAFDKFILDPARDAELIDTTAQQTEQDILNRTPDNSIAVLPFTNMSGDSANEPFTLGIHDDLLTHLSRIDTLKTTSRTSVLQYKDTNKTMPQIAEELGVRNILEGSIQRSGNRVRINMQLIDAVTDEHLWAEIYDRELSAENLFAVQGEIATEVAKALSATLLPEEKLALAVTPTRSMAAYDLYLLGRYHWRLATAESADLALGYFQQAIEEDPNYVLALSGLADAYISQKQYGNLTGREAYPLAQEAIEQAMAQDDAVSEIWASLGQLRFMTGDESGALEALEQAIEIDGQNFWAWYRYGNALFNLRRFDESTEALLTAYALEPMSRPINENLGWRYYNIGRFTRARQHFERVDQLQEKDPTQWKEAIARAFLESGEITRAIIKARQILAFDAANTDVMGILSQAYIALGDLAEAELWIERMETINSMQLWRLELFMAQRDHEGAIAYLDDFMTRIGTRHPGLVYPSFQNAYLGEMYESAQSLVEEFRSHYDKGGAPINPYNPAPHAYLFGIEYMLNNSPQDENGDLRRVEFTGKLNTIMNGLLKLNALGYEQPNTYYALAMGHSLQGNPEAALSALEKSVEKGYFNSVQLAIEPSFDSLRYDPRFEAIEANVELRLQTQRNSLAQAQLAPFYKMGQRQPILMSRETIETYQGYFTDGNIVFHFYLDNKGKFKMKRGQTWTPQTLLPSAEDEFYPSDESANTWRFQSDENGVITHVLHEAGGRSSRYKSVAAPPPVIKLERSVLERYVGVYIGEIRSNAAGGTSDVDNWTIRMFVDEEGTLWSDYDDQPDLIILPYTEVDFFTPGFMSRRRFVIDPETGMASAFIANFDGRDIVFERQD